MRWIRILRKGAAEAAGGLLDYLCGSLVFRRQGVKIHLRVNRAGHYVLSVAHFCKDPPRSLPCPGASASFFHIALKTPDLSDGDLPWLCPQDGLYHSEPPLTIAACKAVTLRDVEDCRLTDPGEIVMRLRANWGRGSAQQSKRVLVDSDGSNTH